MRLDRLLPRAALAAACAAPLVAMSAGCEAQSSAATTALIELYTSEGCSSCPPADEQLRALRQSLDPGARYVALALHVGYWDYIGWKDPYAQAAFSERQTRLVRANGRNLRYTPQFFVNGMELRAWRSALRETVARVNALPAVAELRVRADATAQDRVALHAQATARPGAEPAALYVALTESGLVSRVARGENTGRTLAHDHVVRVWIGPVPLEGGTASISRTVDVPPSWNRARLEPVAFVQGASTGAVLQAVSCAQ